MIRRALPGEVDQLCDKITTLDPWKRLEIQGEAMARAVVDDPKRNVVVWDESGQVHGIVMYRTHHSAELLFRRGFGEYLAAHYNIEWPCEWRQIPDGGYVSALAVFEEGRRKGVGSELLRLAESECYRSGLKTMFLMVSEFNKAAQSFYAMQGYQRIGSMEDCLQKGNVEYLMKKQLRNDSETF